MDTFILLLSLFFMTLGTLLSVPALVQTLRHCPTASLRKCIRILFGAGLILLLIFLGKSFSPETAAILAALLIFLAGLGFLSASFIDLLIKRGNSRKLCAIGLIFLTAGILSLTIFAGAGLAAALLLGGLLFLLVSLILTLINLVFLIRRRKSKKLLLLNAAILLSAVAFFVCSDLQITKGLEKKKSGGEIDTMAAPVTVTDVDFEIRDGDLPLEVPLTNGFETKDLQGSGFRGSYRIVYDSAFLDRILEDTSASPDQCQAIIQNSETIPENMKNFFCDFVRRIADRYPSADLSILCRNLSTLQVKEVSSREMMLHCRSVDGQACYVLNENTIYLPQNVVYTEEPGGWYFQCLIHEFCHACRSSGFEDEEGYKNRLTFQSGTDNTILMEAMNSAFSCSLLNYYEPDIAYQMPSNYLRIMLECMDNYSLSDYINHSDLYFLKQLDTYAGYTNYSQVIWKLITLQRQDWADSKTDLPAEKYEPIYAFLCELYYGKYLTEDMSREEALALADELAEKAGFDCPEGYKFNESYFRTCMENLLEERGLR